MSASTESKLLTWGKGILTALLLLVGVNGAQVYTDPVGALGNEIKVVRAQIHSISDIALEVKAMREDINGLTTRGDGFETQIAAITEKLDKIPEPKAKPAKK